MRQTLGCRRSHIDIDELDAVCHGLFVDLGSDLDPVAGTMAFFAVVEVKIEISTFHPDAELLVGLAGGRHDQLVHFHWQLNRYDEAIAEQPAVGDLAARSRSDGGGGGTGDKTARLSRIDQRNGHGASSSVMKTTIILSHLSQKVNIRLKYGIVFAL